MTAADTIRPALANKRLAEQVRSVQLGHLDAARLLHACRETPEKADQLTQDAALAVERTRDVDRQAAFARSLERAGRDAS